MEIRILLFLSRTQVISEVIDDNFEHGLKGLKRLQSRLNNIYTKDERLKAEIEKLKTEAVKAHKRIAKMKEEMTMLSLFGGQMAIKMMFGNVNFTDKYTRPMYSRFRKVEKLLDESYNDSIPSHLLKFESRMTSNKSLNKEQKEQIRAYIEQKLRKRLAELTPADQKETLNSTLTEIFRNSNRLATEHTITPKK